METTLNDPDDRNNKRFGERSIIRILRESSGGSAAPGAPGEKRYAYMWVFSPRHRPDRKWLRNSSLQ
ncbi:MAG: hypothetical protein NTX59_11995 [Elusimicrobia bacterium]|nr:hypothetical protein [Elusimicrobiota bacterium]